MNRTTELLTLLSKRENSQILCPGNSCQAPVIRTCYLAQMKSEPPTCLEVTVHTTAEGIGKEDETWIFSTPIAVLPDEHSVPVLANCLNFILDGKVITEPTADKAALTYISQHPAEIIQTLRDLYQEHQYHIEVAFYTAPLFDLYRQALPTLRNAEWADTSRTIRGLIKQALR